MWIAAEMISTIIWWMGCNLVPFYSNIYHPFQPGNVYSNRTNKEKLQRLVIKIRLFSGHTKWTHYLKFNKRPDRPGGRYFN